jgi:predicted ATP-dependent endonuclease of OLD family
MQLESLKYNRLKGKSKEWFLEGRDGQPVRFGNINLIVGKNSAGKTQTLAVIREMAGLLSGHPQLSELRYAGASYDVSFRDGKDVYRYILEYEDKTAVNEALLVNGHEKVKRANKQLYSEISGNWEPVDIEDNKLIVSLHDATRFPYLEKLYQWGLTLKNTAFSNQIEKNYLINDLSLLDTDFPSELKDSALLLYVFKKGVKLFGQAFTDRIISDMNKLGHDVLSIDIQKIEQGYALCLQEKELDDVTDQLEMSQGMFRALSFLINLNFARMNHLPVCILIDDLGEGLDFNRSEKLPDLLSNELSDSNIQLFITTNDRNIMNKFPLKCWSVIKRINKKTIFYNYYNSQNIFDEFDYTGLNNFDFLETDFYINGFGDIREEQDEEL